MLRGTRCGCCFSLLLYLAVVYENEARTVHGKSVNPLIGALDACGDEESSLALLQKKATVQPLAEASQLQVRVQRSLELKGRVLATLGKLPPGEAHNIKHLLEQHGIIVDATGVAWTDKELKDAEEVLSEVDRDSNLKTINAPISRILRERTLDMQPDTVMVVPIAHRQLIMAPRALALWSSIPACSTEKGPIADLAFVASVHEHDPELMQTVQDEVAKQFLRAVLWEDHLYVVGPIAER